MSWRRKGRNPTGGSPGWFWPIPIMLQGGNLGDRRAGRGQRADGHALLPCAWLRRCARFQVFLAQALAIGGQYLTAEIPARDVRESRIATAVTDAAIAAIQRAGDGVDMGF